MNTRGAVLRGAAPSWICGRYAVMRALTLAGGLPARCFGRERPSRANTFGVDSCRAAVMCLFALISVLLASGTAAEPLLDSATALDPVTTKDDCSRAGCHVVAVMAEPTHPLVEASNCAACHAPGEADGVPHPDVSGEKVLGMLSQPASQSKTCLECHADALEPSSRAKPAAEESKSESEDNGWYDHTPTQHEACDECHLIHGGSRGGLLSGPYPVRDHAIYEQAAYSGCFSTCHPPELVEARLTTTATRFRNADDNLHYRHVVDTTGRRGHSCRLCHASHQARNPQLIRPSMPYGKERLTLEFSARDTGGRCATSCHLTAEYDREEAIPSRMRVIAPNPVPEKNP